MGLLVRFVFAIISRPILSLRYRVRVRGLKQIRGLKGSVLVLCNHPAAHDSLLVFFYLLWPLLKTRPMSHAVNFQDKLPRSLMRLYDAVRVPSWREFCLDESEIERAQEAVEAVIAGLKKGDNFVLWPAGRIQLDGRERLGGSRSAAAILRAVPEATVVLVRTRGLWGSMFGYARTGGKFPNVVRCFSTGLRLLLANLLVFMPRRPVTITVERLDRSRLPELRRETLNPWLEAWFNEGGPEKPTYVPYHFAFGRRTIKFPKIALPNPDDVVPIRPEVRKTVAPVVADALAPSAAGGA